MEANGMMLPLLQQWPDPLLVIDSNGAIVAVSQAALAVTQWKENQLLGKNAHHILCADTYDHHHTAQECPLLSRADGTSKTPVKESMYWIDGEDNHISVDFHLRPAPLAEHRLVIFKVLAPGEYSVAELKKLARLCEVTPTPLLEVGGDGTIYFANPAMIKMMVEHGFDVSGASELLPDNLTELVQTVINTGKPLLNIEKNLRYLTFLWQLFPYCGGGRDTTVLLTGNDLTEQNKATQRAKLSERQLLIERERMRREYIAKMVHDLRSPLNAIVGFGSVLQHSATERLDAEETEMLGHIVKGGRDLAEQISESLALARVEAAQMHVTLLPTQLKPIIENIAHTLAPLAAEKNLRLAHACETLEITADARLLGQALTNLVANSIKFTSYGSITIEAHRIDARYYCITVSDTGCGIASENISSIFSPFVREQRQDSSAVEGQGLGLSIVNDIVSLHGGSVSVDSCLGKGTRFSLRLPLMP